MRNNYTNQLLDLYTSRCVNYYKAINTLPDENVYRKEEGINNKVGYLNIYVTTGNSQLPIENATVTIFVRKGKDMEMPIMVINTTMNPIMVQIPVAYSQDSLIEGPQYPFSAYNLLVNANGYYTTHILNIRMFPGIVTDFNISMIPTTESGLEHKGERIIEIPTHPIDIIPEK